MATTKPGNHDRGWNDPPVFLHNNSNANVSTPPRRGLLNKRVAYPIHADASKSDPVLKPNVPAGLPPSGSAMLLIPSNGIESTDTSQSPPVLFNVGDQPTQNDETKAPALTSEQLTEQVVKDFNTEDDKEFLARVSSKILSFLEECTHIQNRVREDVKKKLEIFTDFWVSGKICQTVKLKMALVSQALEEHNCDRANSLHLELMYDFVSEVGPWMVGVKRLIVEGRRLQSAESQSNLSESSENQTS